VLAPAVYEFFLSGTELHKLKLGVIFLSDGLRYIKDLSVSILGAYT